MRQGRSHRAGWIAGDCDTVGNVAQNDRTHSDDRVSSDKSGLLSCSLVYHCARSDKRVFADVNSSQTLRGRGKRHEIANDTVVRHVDTEIQMNEAADSRFR